MKKIWKFLSSMGFAVALLVILAAACALSSLVEQGLTREAYAARYGESAASVILALHVDDAYHSVWFAGLSGLLCLNLVLCSVIHFPSFLRRFRAEKDTGAVDTKGNLGETETAQPEKVFAALAMKDPVRCTARDGRAAFYATRNRAGIWGAWICHVGVLLLIAGFSLGQMTLRESVIWGIPGDTRTMPETGLEITIDDFRTETREDSSVSQYVTEITITDPVSGKQEKASVSVNNPADAGGFRLYQNNTGWAASVSVTRNGEETQRKTLLPGQGMEESVLGLADQPEYAFYFAGVRTMREEDGTERTVFFYDLYRAGILQQDTYFFGEASVPVGEDVVTFTPARFTLLVARQDRFAPLALLGGVITMAGLFLAFILQPKAVWAVEQEDGKWLIRGRCRKGQALMRDQIGEAVRNAEKEGKQANAER